MRLLVNYFLSKMGRDPQARAEIDFDERHQSAGEISLAVGNVREGLEKCDRGARWWWRRAMWILPGV